MIILKFYLTAALEFLSINCLVRPREIETYLIKPSSTFRSLSQVHILYKSEFKL